MCDRKGLLCGLLLGGLAGLAAGMLVAPERGEDARRKLREQARTSAEEFAVKLKDGAEDIMHVARDHIPTEDGPTEKPGEEQEFEVGL